MAEETTSTAQETTAAPAPAPETAPEETKEPEKKYTDADVDAIIDRKFAAWSKKQQKAVDEAAKLAQMDAKQKAEYERDQLQAELDQLKKEKTLSEMTAQARKMLSADNVTVPDEILSGIVTEDADQTAKNVKAFSTAFRAAVDAAVKDALKGSVPRTGGSSAITKDEIMKVADTAQRQKLIRDNITLFTGGRK